MESETRSWSPIGTRLPKPSWSNYLRVGACEIKFPRANTLWELLWWTVLLTTSSTTNLWSTGKGSRSKSVLMQSLSQGAKKALISETWLESCRWSEMSRSLTLTCFRLRTYKVKKTCLILTMKIMKLPLKKEVLSGTQTSKLTLSHSLRHLCRSLALSQLP